MNTENTNRERIVNVLAGIVLFNPDMERLKQNISAILPQVDKLVLVDNGSDIFDVTSIQDEDIVYLRNEKNIGIASALNQIMQYAYDNGYDWALTLDQDSVVADNLMVVYSGIADKENIGIVCCKTVDRNFKELDEDKTFADHEVKYCITSASLTNVKGWKQVGGFDESMFIDWVDWDICIALRHAGYKIIKTDHTHILHELGTNTRLKHIGKFQIMILNRSAIRYYYVARNWIYLGRKWHDENLFIKILQVIKMLLVALMFENNKRKNFIAFYKGTIDGFKMKVRR